MFSKGAALRAVFENLHRTMDCLPAAAARDDCHLTRLCVNSIKWRCWLDTPFVFIFVSLQHNTTNDTDAEDVDPTLREVEHV
jgi:hypothetical protein